MEGTLYYSMIYQIELDCVSLGFNLLKLWEKYLINNNLMIKSNIHP
jgi:hypothetical protein